LETLKLDTANDSQVAQVGEQARKLLGDKGLNLLVNNAGMLDESKSKLEDLTSQIFLTHYHTNSVAPLMITKELLPCLKKAAAQSSHGGAKVINISSDSGSFEGFRVDPAVASVSGLGQSYQYRSSKAALNMITNCMAGDLARSGIVVLPLHPGWVRNRMGTDKGMISETESVSGMLKVIAKADIKDTGKFYDYKGEKVPW